MIWILDGRLTPPQRYMLIRNGFPRHSQRCTSYSSAKRSLSPALLTLPAGKSADVKRDGVLSDGSTCLAENPLLSSHQADAGGLCIFAPETVTPRDGLSTSARLTGKHCEHSASGDGELERHLFSPLCWRCGRTVLLLCNNWGWTL